MSIGLIAYLGTMTVLAVVVAALGALSIGAEKESAKHYSH